MNAPQTLTTRELPEISEREVWICVERPMPGGQAVLLQIAPGSAIVAAPMRPGTDYVKIYYEGNVYRFSNQHQYDERLANAWGRVVYRAPTIAMMGHSIGDFVNRFDIVGTFDGKVKTLVAGGEERLAEVQRKYIELSGRPGEVKP